jgi:spermidine synthase
VPFLGGLYTEFAGSGPASLILRALVASICLLPPTLLMGGTLPVVARGVDSSPNGVSWLGYFYGGNLLGAVTGSLLAGFYLLRVYDMPTATLAAVGLNVLVAVIALLVAGRIEHRQSPIAVQPVPILRGNRLVYVAIALSGLTALGAEVVWTRLLSLLFGATTYTFSLILAVFLMGLGIGSSIGAAIARQFPNSRVPLAFCQLLLCGAIAWAAHTTGTSMPYWPINPSIGKTAEAPVFQFELDLLRAFWVVLPGAILWGASFPLAIGAAAREGEDTGRLVGGVYAANTVGAILGALLTSLILVAAIGSQKSQQVLIAISAISGLLMLVTASDSGDGASRGVESSRFRGLTPILGMIAAGAIAGLLMRTVPPLPGILIAYGRYAATWIGINEIIYSGEGVTASVAVSRTPSGVLNYHNAGKVQASSEPQDMRLQRMLGHLTTLVPDNPQRVLVIGCGAGVTAGAVSVDPLVKSETIAEIEPLVPRVVSKYFSEYNFNVVANPKVTVHLDDARHYLLTTREKFDAITSDPLDPWVRGAATLYTREFFEVAKAHLNPGGVVTLFVQLYESNDAAVKSEVATFLDAFPGGMVFANTSNGLGYDLVLLGQVEPTKIDVDAIEAKLQRPEYAPLKQSLREIGMHSAVDLFSTYAGRKPDLEPWLRTAQINHDRNLRLQYLAGLGLNLYQADIIYSEMLRYVSKMPDDLFVGSETTKKDLFGAIQRAQGR